MAKKLSSNKLRELKERILHRGDYLELVAFEWKLPLEILKRQLEATYDGGRKNSQYKAIIQTSERNASKIPEEDLAKMKIEPKPTRQAKASAIHALAVPAEISTAADSREELLRKRDELKEKASDCASSLEQAKAILDIRQRALADAQAVLAKAQAAVKNAKFDVAEAKKTQQRVKAQQVKALQDLQQIEEKIQKSQVYLVAPWYSGDFPELGTFFSTEEREGFQILKPAEPIEPDFKDMVSADFNQVSEYVSALCFVSLVQEYILKGKAHHVLNTDPRVQKLLDKHIG